MALSLSSRMLGCYDGDTNFATYSFIVTSGVTVTAGDFVYFASGKITNASIAGALLVGMAMETVVGDGTATALVCVDPDMRYLLDNDNVDTTFAATHVGTKFDLTGATGAQLVDTSSTGTTGQLLCLEYNPQIDPVSSDTSYGVFVIQESIFTNGSAAQA